MTSNLGSEVIQERMDALDGELTSSAEEVLNADVMTLLKKKLRPEFLNRIDEIVMFRPLGRAEIRKIVDVQFARVQAIAEKSH